MGGRRRSGKAARYERLDAFRDAVNKMFVNAESCANEKEMRVLHPWASGEEEERMRLELIKRLLDLMLCIMGKGFKDD